MKDTWMMKVVYIFFIFWSVFGSDDSENTPMLNRRSAGQRFTWKDALEASKKIAQYQKTVGNFLAYAYIKEQEKLATFPEEAAESHRDCPVIKKNDVLMCVVHKKEVVWLEKK